MTWKEFKDAVEALGVKDEDLISYIDISGFDEPEDMKVEEKRHGWAIWS